MLEEKPNHCDGFVKTKEMKKSEYLYGVQASIFKGLFYEFVLQLKIELTIKLIKKLLEEHYLNRDDQRISAVLNAQKHNYGLLAELNE